MEYRLYKIYDPDVNDIAVGIRLADCMMPCNDDDENEKEKNAEENVAQKIQTLTISNVRNCTICRVSFDDTLEQRKHYKLDWHRYNLKRALADKHAVTEEVFEGLLDDVSSISASDSGSSDKEDSDSESNDLKEKKDAQIQNDKKSARGRHSKAFFENSNNEIFSVYRCLLQSKKEIYSNSSLTSSLTNILSGPKKWLIVMLGGGHFAAAIFNDSKVIEHKTFHCYTARGKQGGSQSSRDNRGGGHPKSAGASLRRYNEQSLTQHVQKIMSSWAEPMKECQLIFYRAPGRYNREVIFGGKNARLDKTDPRLRNIPFPTRRATFKEVQRVHDVLCTLEVYGCADYFKDKYPRSPDKRYESGAVSVCSENNEKRKKKKTPQKIDRSKARSSPEREIPGENINEIFEDDSSSNEDEIVLNSGYAEVNFRELRECYDTAPASTTETDSSDSPTRKTPYEQQCEAIQKQLKNSCLNKNKDLLIKTLQIYDTLPEKLDDENNPEGNLLTKEDFMKCLNAGFTNSNRDTVLHLTASYALPEFTTLLLEAGADPTIRNKYFFTPYVMSGDKETKKSFTKYIAKYPDRVDRKLANIPEPLSEEVRKAKDEKRREKNRQKRMRDKIRKREMKERMMEEDEKQKFLALNDGEKLALNENHPLFARNAENARVPIIARCFLCGIDISGKVPFEYGMNRFCSVPCVKAHRAKFNEFGLNL